VFFLAPKTHLLSDAAQPPTLSNRTNALRVCVMMMLLGGAFAPLLCFPLSNIPVLCSLLTNALTTTTTTTKLQQNVPLTRNNSRANVAAPQSVSLNSAAQHVMHR
jgi:hypothetical protein